MMHRGFKIMHLGPYVSHVYHFSRKDKEAIGWFYAKHLTICMCVPWSQGNDRNFSWLYDCVERLLTRWTKKWCTLFFLCKGPYLFLQSSRRYYIEDSSLLFSHVTRSFQSLTIGVGLFRLMSQKRHFKLRSFSVYFKGVGAIFLLDFLFYFLHYFLHYDRH
jgi:hypothetical protein